MPAKTPANSTSSNTTTTKPNSGPGMPVAPAPESTSLTEFKWEAPEKPNSGTRRDQDAYHSEAAMLRSRPGEWAVIKVMTGKSARSAAYRLAAKVNKAEIPAFTPGDGITFEATSRTNGEGVKVYARAVKTETAAAK